MQDEEQHEAYNRGELSALIRIQYEERMAAKRKRKKVRAQARLSPLPSSSGRHGSSPFLSMIANRMSQAAPKVPDSELAMEEQPPNYPPSRVGALDLDPTDGRRL